MFTTRDPDKAAFKVATKDPSKGFGAGVLFGGMPEDQLTEEQKRQLYESGALQDPQKMKKGGMIKSSASKRADGCAKKGKTKGRMV
jgi:hypothetical protein